DIKEQGIQIYNTSSSLNDNITGGRIKCAGYLYNDRADFTPNAGIFEMYGPTGANIRCTNGGRFWDLAINKVDGGDGLMVKPFTDRDGTCYDGGKEANTATAVSNISVYSHLYIDGGTFDLGIYDFTSIGGSAFIYGNLKMSDPANDFSVNWDIFWKPGSTDEITNGNFWVKRHWYFEDGTNAQISWENTVHFNGTGIQYIYSLDSDAQMGGLSIDNTSNTVWIHSSSTQPLQVDGSMTVSTGSTFQIQGKSLEVVDGTLTIEDGATMYLSSSGGGQLTANWYFDIYGSLIVGSGEVFVIGMAFDLWPSGYLFIDGGSFIEQSNSSHNFIRGEFIMHGGLYQTNATFSVRQVPVLITGGTIKCDDFESPFPNTFQPTGGIVEIISEHPFFHFISCAEGNYFNNLKINVPADAAGVYPSTDLEIKLDLTIESGTFDLQDQTVTV
ncbi:MAG TPA: hypothetical protein PLI65_11470, partial [Bacteroidales bacterium]|nr:hypothetical protein [Bacteroidales bacterium]